MAPKHSSSKSSSPSGSRTSKESMRWDQINRELRALSLRLIRIDTAAKAHRLLSKGYDPLQAGCMWLEKDTAILWTIKRHTTTIDGGTTLHILFAITPWGKTLHTAATRMDLFTHFTFIGDLL